MSGNISRLRSALSPRRSHAAGPEMIPAYQPCVSARRGSRSLSHPVLPSGKSPLFPHSHPALRASMQKTSTWPQSTRHSWFAIDSFSSLSLCSVFLHVCKAAADSNLPVLGSVIMLLSPSNQCGGSFSGLLKCLPSSLDIFDAAVHLPKGRSRLSSFLLYYIFVILSTHFSIFFDDFFSELS